MSCPSLSRSLKTFCNGSVWSRCLINALPGQICVDKLLHSNTQSQPLFPLNKQTSRQTTFDCMYELQLSKVKLKKCQSVYEIVCRYLFNLYRPILIAVNLFFQITGRPQSLTGSNFFHLRRKHELTAFKSLQTKGLADDIRQYFRGNHSLSPHEIDRIECHRRHNLNSVI